MNHQNKRQDKKEMIMKVTIPSLLEILCFTAYMGWLYLPRGNEKCPLVVMTNGGGDGSRSIKSFSDFMAPILVHCGIAAFVHDKRGTGESEGIYVNTTYNDYITDAGNCGIILSKHKRIDPEMIGAKDRVVPTDESVRNINRYMSTSGNRQCNIAIIPRMGHVPVDIETKRRINFDYLIINWLNQNVKE